MITGSITRIGVGNGVDSTGAGILGGPDVAVQDFALINDPTNL